MRPNRHILTERPPWRGLLTSLLLIAACGPGTPDPTDSGTENIATSDAGAEDLPEFPGGSTSTYTAVTAGLGHTCALREDGQLDCWGLGSRPARPEGPGGGTLDKDQAVPPGGEFLAVAAGRLFTCAIRADETLTCWGDADNGQLDAPDGSFTQLHAGGDVACALTETGALECWGSSEHGLDTPPEGTFTDVAITEDHACAVDTAGTIVCWGREYEAASPPSGQFKRVAVGEDRLNGVGFSCAIDSEDALVCWGTGADSPFNAPPAGTLQDIAVGSQNRCATGMDDTVRCWGGNIYGQNNAPSEPHLSVTAGPIHYCGIRTDRKVVCWGDDEYGQVSLIP